jgi:putative tryptophan/tyrosine transport system substrate-binding protein
MGLQIQVLKASNIREINAAFATFVRERPDALYVGGGPFFNTRRIQLAILAARYLVPMTPNSVRVSSPDPLRRAAGRGA